MKWSIARLLEWQDDAWKYKWHRWWAWRPVVVDQHIVWLEVVERQRVVWLCGACSGMYWRYRLPTVITFVARGDPDMPGVNRNGDAFR